MKNIARSLFFRLGLHDVVHTEIEQSRKRQQAAILKLEARLDKLRTDLASEARHVRTIDRRQEDRRESHKELVEVHRSLAQQLGRLEERVGFLEQVHRSDVSGALLLAMSNLAEAHPTNDISAHFKQRLDETKLQEDPYPHLIINDVLPSAFYQLLLDEKPPSGYWRHGQKGRKNWTVGEDIAPLPTEATWQFMDQAVAGTILAPALATKFNDYLSEYYGQPSSGNSEISTELAWHQTGGRLMLRSPGYRLEPHLDPRRSALTALLYLGTSDDSPEHGTNLFKINHPLPTQYQGIYYPEREGATCELVKRVPFRPNSMLVLASRIALHGADIPDNAQPSTLKRYTYQFYIALDEGKSFK